MASEENQTSGHALVYGVSDSPAIGEDLRQPLFGGTVEQINNALLGRVIYRGGPPVTKP